MYGLRYCDELTERSRWRLRRPEIASFDPLAFDCRQVRPGLKRVQLGSRSTVQDSPGSNMDRKPAFVWYWYNRLLQEDTASCRPSLCQELLCYHLSIFYLSQVRRPPRPRRCTLPPPSHQIPYANHRCIFSNNISIMTALGSSIG